ncbi:MAG: tetratricopeptide repeat protein [Nitrospirota bacterium]
MKTKPIYFLFYIVVVILLLSVSITGLQAAEEYELFIAQGIEKINEGKYSEAVEILDKALAAAPDNIEAIYYSAIAHSRLGELGKAESLLLKIRSEDKPDANVYFELGRIYYSRGDCRRAEKNMNKSISISGDAKTESYADSLIKDCYDRGGEKRFKADLTIGGQYDSNVVLEPDNPSITDDRKSDWRAVALLKAGAKVYENNAVLIRADYNFYQSLHAKLDNFDVHYHKVTPSIELNVSDVVRPSAGYKYEYIFFGGDEYGTIHTFFTKVNIKENMDFSTDVIVEFSDHKYWDSEEFLSNSDRRGQKTVAGIKQNFAIGEVKSDIHYFHDRKNARENFWSYKGDRVGAATGFNIIEPLRFKASAEYSWRKHFDQDFPAYNERREDRMQKYALSLQYSLSKKMAVTLTGSYTFNDSNIEDFEYQRNIIGLLFTYGLI